MEPAHKSKLERALNRIQFLFTLILCTCILRASRLQYYYGHLNFDITMSVIDVDVDLGMFPLVALITINNQFRVLSGKKCVVYINLYLQPQNSANRSSMNVEHFCRQTEVKVHSISARNECMCQCLVQANNLAPRLSRFIHQFP